MAQPHWDFSQSKASTRRPTSEALFSSAPASARATVSTTIKLGSIPPELKKSSSAMRLIVSMTSAAVRSEEHTSELQSLMRISYAVFCLKKKKEKEQNELMVKRRESTTNMIINIKDLTTRHIELSNTNVTK